MSKWLGLFIVLLVGGVWYFRGGEETELPEVEALTPGAPVVVQAEQEPAVQPAAGTAPQPTASARQPSVPAAGPASPAEAPALRSEAPPQPAVAPVGAILERVGVLTAAGRAAEAEALLRSQIVEAPSADARARLGLVLASLSTDGGERRRLLTAALRQGVVEGPEYEAVGSQLAQLNRDPRSSLFGFVPTEKYTVRAGDSLWKLCNRTLPEEHGVRPEVGLVRLFNGMSSDSLQVGQTLLVPKAGVEIVVDRRQHGLVAYLGEVALVAYRVGLGKEGRTPSGEFVVQVKQTDPTWYRKGRSIPHGDPENILGTRWMGFENNPGAMGYGIHGTERPESIGKDESMGCVRMRNPEVEQLFELVPRGTRVLIP